MKLYYNPMSTNGRLAYVTAVHLGTQLETHVVEMAKGEHKSPEYLAINPNGKVPALVDGDFKLWESGAIAMYLCELAPRSNFYPTDAKGRADVARWNSWKLAHFGPAVGGIVWERFMKKVLMNQPADEAKVKASEEQFHLFAPVMNAHLETHQWLVNDTLTLADFTVGCPMTYAQASNVSLERYPHIKAWWDRLSQVSAWQKTAPKM